MKLCVIGIDALDPDLLTRWSEFLPTFQSLMRSGKWERLQSTFPPDSIPSWTTIYTGKEPSHHGALEYVDYLDIKHGQKVLDNSRLRGQTFWDRVAASGRRVLVLNPFMAYPAWDTGPGIMVSGPVFVDGNVSVTPSTLQLPADLPELGGMVEFPTSKTLDVFYERCVRVTEGQSRFFREMLSSHPWDLAHVLFLTLDRIKHFYWRFEDRDDPYFKHWEKRPHPVLDFYKLLDREVGAILASLPAGTPVVVISDHGHQRRCTSLFYVNELLRKAGLLEAPRGLRSLLAPGALVERAKNIALDVAFTFEMEDGLAAIAPLIPRRKALKRGDHVIQDSRSVARTSSFAGVNPFGGVVVNSQEAARRGLARSKVVDAIVELLKGAEDRRRGKKPVRWAAPREQVLRQGARLEAYPDVLFELDPEYGVSWAIFRPLFGPSVTHRKISGGHTRDGVLIAAGEVDPAAVRKGMSVADVYPLVMTHFGL